MLQNLSSAAVVIGALRVKYCSVCSVHVPFINMSKLISACLACLYRCVIIALPSTNVFKTVNHEMIISS